VSFLASRERLTIPGPAGPLEAIGDEAQGVAQSRYAVVCHPHPLHGGTMDNKVVYTVARALQAAGVVTLRFNFRGVGKSAGEYDGGTGETQDAAAVAAYGAARWPDRRLISAGFSFGAFVALRLALERDAAYLITVAPPVDLFDFSNLTAPRCPWLVVQGDADDVVEPASVIAWVKRLDPQPRLVVVPGVGHFFHGHLAELRDSVSEALRSG
jgi:alpha/beta superfamily hydrolase